MSSVTPMIQSHTHSLMRIGSPIITETGNQTRLTASLVCANERHELYYSVPSEYGHWLAADRCDGFVVGLLLQAMQQKKDIVVEGPLSERLYHNLQDFFIPLVAQTFPNLHPIQIVPATLIDLTTGGKGVATGFSAGIDSFATVIQHYINENSPDYKISHFLFHNVGSHGHENSERARRLFWQRYENARPYTQEVGIPIVPVDSNLAEIFAIDFVKMHSVLNASIPLVLQNQFQRYYYASGHKYADCGVNHSDDMARLDPLAFHLLSTEGLACVSSGCQMSRVEKTALVADYEPSYRYLNVCVDSAFEGHNCSVCFKCRRTIFTLDMLDKVHLYDKVFDYEKYKTIRSHYICHLLRVNKGSVEFEITNLAIERSNEWWVSLLKLKRFLTKS